MNQETKDKIIEGVLSNPHYLENSSDVVLLIDIVANLTEKQILSHANLVIDESIQKEMDKGKIQLLKEIKQRFQI